ncbi:MAG TPA: hypothetical protein VK902_20265 [Rubrobacter sp.]|nr:hypothetical protein [Rubrobacter sp.]
MWYSPSCLRESVCSCKEKAPWVTPSSVELAERLYEDAVSRAFSYLSDAGETSRIGVGEEVQEARARAVWHPHPDDPPQN